MRDTADILKFLIGEAKRYQFISFGMYKFSYFTFFSTIIRILILPANNITVTIKRLRYACKNGEDENRLSFMHQEFCNGMRDGYWSESSICS